MGGKKEKESMEKKSKTNPLVYRSTRSTLEALRNLISSSLK